MRQPKTNPEVIILRKKKEGPVVPPASIVFNPEKGMIFICVKDMCQKCSMFFEVNDIMSSHDIKEEKSAVLTRMNIMYIQLKQKMERHICKG